MNFLGLKNTSKTLEKALKSRFSITILCLWSYTEAFIFPIPPDPFLIALILVNKNRLFLYVSLCTIFSLLGGITGYYIGLVFWEELGIHITEYMALTDQVNNFKNLYNANGAFAVFIAGVSPIPYKLVTLISGISGMNFIYFCVFSILSRGLRFFLVGLLIFYFGDWAKRFIEKRLGIVTLFIILVIILTVYLLGKIWKSITWIMPPWERYH